MENRDQTPSSSSSPENRSSPSPVNHHPPFEKPRLNPFKDTLLADYLNGLSLSEPRHPSWDPHDSVLSRRVQSAVQGQNGNFRGGALPRGLGPGYYEESVNCCNNLINNRVNGPFGPDPMYVPNGLIGPKFSSRPELDFLNRPVQLGQISSNYHNHFNYDNMINSGNRVMNQPGSIYSEKDNGSFCLPIMDSFGPSLDPNSLFGPDQMYLPNGPFSSRPNSVHNGPMYNQNVFSNRPKTMYNKNVDGLFGPDFLYDNGLSKSLLSQRPKHKILGNQSGLGQTGPIHSGKPGNSSGWPGEDYSIYQLKDFRGNIKKMAKNRECSGFLKKKIEDGAEEDLELIFDEVKDDLASLIVNYFGSIVVQKLFKVCRPEQISHVLFSLIGSKFELVEICCDNHGSAAMGKLLENLTTRDQRTWFISALSSVVLNLCKDQNGLKVVKYCIDHFPENADVLINEIASDCFEIATHKSGCCIFEPCLSRADGETLERFMDQLGPNAAILSVHQYGNYVVQSLLDKKNPSITRNIIAQLAGNYVYISMDRCGSNVVEKCLIVASENEAIKIIIEIMNSDKFAMLLTDPYGNYVVQKALEVSQKMRWKEIREKLENRIMQFYASLHSHPYGNRVLSKLKNFPKRS